MTTYDAIIIGTGQAGPSLARRMAGRGQKVAIIERARFGGTCVNTGCTPTKALVASAYAAHLARRGAEYGVTIPGPVGIDMKRVKAAIAGASSKAVEASLAAENLTVIQGHARFTSAREVAIGDAVMSAETCAQITPPGWREFMCTAQQLHATAARGGVEILQSAVDLLTARHLVWRL